MSLDKVLRLAQTPVQAPDSAEYVRAASDALENLALLLAKKAKDLEDDTEDEDTDNDGGDVSEKSDDSQEGKNGRKQRPMAEKHPKRKPNKQAREIDRQQVKTSRELVLEAMVALSHLHGAETICLSVLTQKEREKPGAHTIPGSTDFPIPDESHLSAAVREYHAGNLAGHSRDEVARHIRTSAKRLGKQVDLTADPVGEVIHLAAKPALVAMEHGPFNGTHRHPHRTGTVVDAEHTHNNDSRHGDMERW